MADLNSVYLTYSTVYNVLFVRLSGIDENSV